MDSAVQRALQAIAEAEANTAPRIEVTAQHARHIAQLIGPAREPEWRRQELAVAGAEELRRLLGPG